MATKLSVYNEALNVLGETPLSVITEMRPLRSLLDTVWAGASGNDAAIKCLEMGMWNFASRSIEMSYDTDVTPAFGFTYAYEKPDDYVRLIAFCHDEYMRETIMDYVEEGSYFMADPQTVYMQYVSKDSTKGLDLTLWTPSFETYVAHYLAHRAAATHIKDRKRRAEIKDDTRKALLNARNQDAMNQPALQPRESGWSRSRRGSASRRDRGNRSSLTG